MTPLPDTVTIEGIIRGIIDPLIQVCLLSAKLLIDKDRRSPATLEGCIFLVNCLHYIQVFISFSSSVCFF